MKKSIAIIMVIVMVLAVCFTTSVFAEEVVEEEQQTSGYDQLVEDVAEKVGKELPDGVVQSLIQLIENWEKTNKEATLGDRIKEFFNPDNLVNTVSMLFMVVCGVIIFMMKNRQTASIKDTNQDLIQLKAEIDEQIAVSGTTSKDVKALNDTMGKLIQYLDYLGKKVDGQQDSAEAARQASIGVATMVKNIFQNSKTIDQAGKRIMNIDYLKAIGESVDEILEAESANKEEVKEQEDKGE